MTTLTVLEFHREGVWVLPRAQLERLARDFPDVRIVSPADEAEADRWLPEADVVFGWAVRRDNFATARALRWIHVSAAGLGGLLFPALVESPVVVTNGRGLHAVAMAEHTLGVLLAFARRLHLARDAQRERRWTQAELWAEGPGFRDLEGSTLGIVGLGRVGSAIASRARALGLRVVAVRRYPAVDPGPADEQWGLDRLDELLSRADWLVLALPTTRESRGLLGREALARMKPGAVLINLGRGALVDEPALIDALRSGHLGGAALDVFAQEPLPAESPLWDLPQVILTPHVSGIGPRYWERAVDQFARNLRAFTRGGALENLVDKRAGY